MLIERLNPDKPFKDAREERNSFLELLDMLLEAYKELGKKDTAPKKTEAFREDVFSTYGALLSKCQLSIDSGKGFPISKIIWISMPEPIEVLAFLLAMSTVEDGKYEKNYADMLNKAGSSSRPTVGLCAELAALFLPKNELKIDVYRYKIDRKDD